MGLVLPRPAEAHEVGLSRGVYTLAGAEVVAAVTFARGELRALAPGLDRDGDGSLGADELTAGSPALGPVAAQIGLMADGAGCASTLVRAGLTEEDGAELVLRFRCSRPPERLTLTWALFPGLAPGHRHLARFVRPGADPEDSVAEPVLHARAATATIAAAGASAGRPALAYFELGVEHILIGVDHLVFLLGLVVVGGALRSLVAVITAFTVGHSLSLALATLGLWTPDARWVEPAIALSVVYVGAENLFVADARGRWRITLPFGFIHGFGFAGVLAEIGLPAGEVGAALLLFNLGVEAGQLAALALALPLLALLRRWRGFREAEGARWISAAIVSAGLGWFVARVLGE